MTALPPAFVWEDSVIRALQEDFGQRGDVTTRAIFSQDAHCKADFVARQDGIVSGLDVARRVFALVDPSLEFSATVKDGVRVKAGQAIASLSGGAIGVLEGERIALNFLCHLSGVATLTGIYAGLVAGTKARIACTRKTTPGLRALEKYAVVCGGGVNHRFGLHDAVLIKDNHIAVAGGIAPAIEKARAAVGHMIKIEVEVDTPAQLHEALAHKIDAVLLDNWPIGDLPTAVALIDGRVTIEASGGINEKTVRAVAETGVDLISVGALTHSAPVFDIGLDILEKERTIS